jgi:hypothetical protein
MNWKKCERRRCIEGYCPTPGAEFHTASKSSFVPTLVNYSRPLAPKKTKKGKVNYRTREWWRKERNEVKIKG